MASIFNLQQVNSSSYADQLAIQLGLFQDRQIGETTDHYLDRLYSAAYSRRDHSLEGTVNNIVYQLGLTVQAGISITATDPTTVIVASTGQITLTAYGGVPLVISTVTIALDNMWVWRNLSDIVSDINSLSGGTITATLLIPDGLTIQIPDQSSLDCSIAEPIKGINAFLNNSGIVSGSELFSVPVPAYELDNFTGALAFTSSPSPGAAISYIYNQLPFTLTCSQVGIINLMNPTLQSTALCSDGTMVYQMQEFNQAILAADPSYWGE